MDTTEHAVDTRTSARLFAESVGRIEPLDRVGQPLAEKVSTLIPEGTLKDALSGTWLGHPLHPLLTDVVVGSWTSAFFLDLLGERTAEGAKSLVGIGVLAALPTALAGVSDWADTGGEERRIGVVHAAGNIAAAWFQTLSYLERRRGNRLAGVLLSLVGFGAATVSAYLGAHLSYSRGVGVDQTAFEAKPTEWVPVLEERDLPEAALTPARAGDVGLVLYKHDGRIDALSDRCSHRGCSLHQGQVTGSSAIACPCHGSTYRLADGAIVRGPSTSPQPSYEVRVREGMVEVRPR